MRRRKVDQGITATGTLARLDQAAAALDEAMKAFEPAAEREMRRQRLAAGRPQLSARR